MGELLKKLGIEDGIIQNILKGMKDNKIYTTNEEKLEERYNKLKEQKEDIEGQLNTVNTTITDLKKNNKDNEALQETIKAYEGTIETLKKDSVSKIRNLTLDSAINNLLSSNKAKHSDLLAGKFDREKLVVDEDGKITGLDEQFKGIKETYKDLFEEKISGITPNNNSTNGGITKEQFAEMGYLERVKLNQENPELYNGLRGEM